MDVSKASGSDQGDAGTIPCDQATIYYDSKEGGVFKKGTVLHLGEERVLQLASRGLQLAGTTQLRVKDVKSNLKVLDIPWKHVITADVKASLPKDNARQTFDLHYVTEMRDRTLRAQCISLTSVSESPYLWVDIIKDRCRKVPGRPNRMLVVVNTIGGMGKSADIYQKKVAPIFQLAQITANVIYTERPQHARDIAENEDLSAFDCVVAVGGDGTFQEVLHGMTVQLQKSARVDYNDVNSKFVSPNKPIGIIPTGSWNCLSAAFNKDVQDVETATLRILTGEIHRSQMYTYHSNGKFMTASALSFAYGTLNHLAKKTEEIRWMRKYRYFYVILAYLFQKKERINLELEYLVAPHQEANTPHGSPDGICKGTNTGLQWLKHDSQGKSYVNLLFGAPTLTTDQEDRTMKNPFADHVHLYVDMGCPGLRYFKLVTAVLNGKKRADHYDNLDIVENVRGIRIKALRPDKEGGAGSVKESSHDKTSEERSCEYSFTVDGECLDLEVPELEIRVIPSFIPIYATQSS